MFTASDQLNTIFPLNTPNQRKTAHDNEKLVTLSDHQQVFFPCFHLQRGQPTYETSGKPSFRIYNFQGNVPDQPPSSLFISLCY